MFQIENRNEVKAEDARTTTNHHNESDEDLHCGLNRREFVTALKLVALAQGSLPCTRQYLYSNDDAVPLPSIWIDTAFTHYLETQRREHAEVVADGHNAMTTMSTKPSMAPYLETSITSIASGTQSQSPFDSALRTPPVPKQSTRTNGATPKSSRKSAERNRRQKEHQKFCDLDSFCNFSPFLSMF